MTTKKDKYDCVIIGSGPGGAPIAWQLAASGMDVLILEAGTRYDPLKDYALNQQNWETKSFPVKTKIKNTYGTKQSLDPAYNHLRSWNKASGDLNNSKERRYVGYQQISGVGGTTLHFQGEAHRLNENAFHTNELYGVGVDWPINYQDLEPYYSKAEQVIGVAGPDKVSFRPRKKPFPMKPHKLSYASQKVGQACKELGIELEHNPLAILSEVYRDAPPCNYCNGCTWGCPRKDKGSVDVTFIPLAEDTGKCEIATSTFVSKIELQKKNGKTTATAVSYYDRSKKEHVVKADYIVVACGAVETPRLLLNSGINQNELVGKNFMETNFYEIVAFHPERLDSYRGIPIDSVIWKWNNSDSKRGFSGGLRLFPTVGSALGPMNYALRYYDGWGQDYVEQMEKWFGHAFAVGGIAEFFPNKNSFISLDSKIKDEFGNPVARIQSFLGEEELKCIDFMAYNISGILDAAGSTEVVEKVSAYDLFLATHVFGTCRMGNDSETSVVDSSLRMHEIPNLLVTDASVFPTSGGGEAPSLTIEALSLRAADLLLKDLKKG